MGLDACITKGRKIVCPKCGEICEIQWEREELECFHNNREVHQIIQEKYNYNTDTYNECIEIDQETLLKILRVLEKNCESYKTASILEAIGHKTVDKHNVIGYSANW